MNNLIIAMSKMKVDFQETLKSKDEEIENLKSSAMEIEKKNMKLEGDYSEGKKENKRLQSEIVNLKIRWKDAVDEADELKEQLDKKMEQLHFLSNTLSNK